ncbi:MAG TPA: META domain-containing protein [Rhodoblastus sp.]|nr:META domain-containing protein [Rhodoblastus sp.]
MKKLAILASVVAAAALVAQPALAQKKHKGQQQQQGEGEKKDDKNAYESPFPTKANWQLTSINGKTPPADASLLIDENLRGTGSSGCNTWSATLYPIKGHRLAMGPVAMTKKTCSNEINGFERAYLTVLRSGPVWDLKGSTLTVKSQYGELVYNRGL